jgi:hypothetical protein
MSRICSICAHPQRDRIDKALLAGQPLREITGHVPIRKSALHRHKQHLQTTLTRAQTAEEALRGDNLLEDLQDLAAEANRLKQKAERSGDLRTAMAGLRELARLIEIRARVVGELRDRDINLNVLNVSVDDSTARRIAETYLARHGAAHEIQVHE